MKDLLLKWPDSETAIAFGERLGCTVSDPDDPSIKKTLSKYGVINIRPKPHHAYLSDNSDPENPVFTVVPGHWALIRVPSDFDIQEVLNRVPAELHPIIQHELNSVDENGDIIPYPDITQAPRLGWA